MDEPLFLDRTDAPLHHSSNQMQSSIQSSPLNQPSPIVQASQLSDRQNFSQSSNLSTQQVNEPVSLLNNPYCGDRI